MPGMDTEEKSLKAQGEIPKLHVYGSMENRQRAPAQVSQPQTISDLTLSRHSKNIFANAFLQTVEVNALSSARDAFVFLNGNKWGAF